MTNVQMIDSNAGEVMHLLEVIKKYSVKCSMEMKMENQGDPFIGISTVDVAVEYVEGHDGDTLVVEMGETEFSFSLKDHHFSKCVSEHQIMVAIAAREGGYIAWFDSGVVPSEGILEANGYDDTIGNDDFYDPVFSEDEMELIFYIRSLDFEDVLDAVSGIEYEADQSKQKATVLLREGSTRKANGFDERVAKLTRLAELIGKVNKDYVAHIYPEAGV